MDYPELCADQQVRLKQAISEADTKIPKIEARIVKERGVLERHLMRAKNKLDDFALASAYADEEHADDVTFCDEALEGPMEEGELRENPIIEDEGGDDIGQKFALEVSSDANLMHTYTLISNKAGLITNLKGKINDLRERIFQNRRLLQNIMEYNPVTEQIEDGERYVNEFDIVSPNKWMIANATRRKTHGRQTNSIFMTTVNMFVPIEYRGLPKDRNVDLDSVSLDNIPFDPFMIPDSFLAGLGWNAPDSELNELDKIKEKAKFISAIKQLMSKCVVPLPISGSGLAFKGTKMNYRLLVVKGHRTMNNGKIIMPRYNTKEGTHLRHKEPSVFNDAYSALRQAKHVTKNYKEESEAITRANNGARELHGRLMSLKKDDPEKEKKKARITEELEAILENLINAVTFYKHIARDTLKCASNLKDRLDRYNPYASLARLVRVTNNLVKRMDEIGKTSLAFPENETSLEAVTNNGEDIIDRYSEAFDRYLFNGDMEKFTGIAGTLSKLQVRPFNLYADRLSYCIGSMNRRKDKRMEFAKRGLKITKLFAIQKMYEDTLYQLDDDVDVFRALDTVEQLKGHIRKTEFGEIATQIDQLMIHAHGGDFKKTKEIKETLKKLDFERLLNAIQ